MIAINPRIEVLPQKKLVGINVRMSLKNNRTFELWNRVIPKFKKLGNRLSADKYSLQVYPHSYFDSLDPTKEFIKWAGVEVEEFGKLADDLEPFILEGGLYAIFNYKGSSNVHEFFQYIYSTWLPNSSYELDERPHFEVLGEKYKNNDPNSEEEIWIPIQPK